LSTRATPDGFVTGKAGITLRQQLLLCLAMVSIAALVFNFSPVRPQYSAFLVGLRPQTQIVLGFVIGSAVGAWSYAGTIKPKHKASQRTIVNYSRFDLSGLNPIWMGLSAGFGEELLFRGAMQPLLGIWLTSAIFVVAHFRAYQFRKIDSTALDQIATLFVASLLLGCIAKYIGLMAAIVAHSLIDIISLYAIRNIKKVLHSDAAQ
jgi:membrane protease YdiL (CAAX protease family)